MRKPGTNEQNVEMSDVLCDFCHREWNEAVPMLEGHQGSCICAKCLTVAYAEVVRDKVNSAPEDYTCPLCLEKAEDRASLGRGDEPGWQSPMEDAAACQRCIKLAAKALHRDKDIDWTMP